MRQNKDKLMRYRIRLYGIVQGVGFRPFIFNKAQELGLKGYVNNEGSSVLIDVQGPEVSVKDFVKTLIKCPPPLAQIEKVDIRKGDSAQYQSFEIIQSSSFDNQMRFIPKDTAICQNCREDIFNQESRWYNYAFINCTDCGPRYSIIKEMPYDRCNTSMGYFTMCPDCSREYHNPKSRRFHAQPVCCPACGPKLQLLDSKGKELAAEDPLRKAVQLLKAGKLLAVKGVGGFHLMCDAENEEAVAELRRRKRRPHKPLAVMAADLDAVEQQCLLDEMERGLISSQKAPIVLLRKKKGCSLPDAIAPDTDRLGMMLPYTPLHLLLFAEGLKYLVATSGNISGMPIEYSNHKALSSLGRVVDYFLLHDRDINIPVDDSVIKAFLGREALSRIGRGYAPLVINTGAVHQLVALGAEQKSSVSISRDGFIHTSQYLGDIKSPEAYEGYKKALDNLIKLLKVKPQAYVHDLHPYYLSTQYAKEQQGQKIAIQHHFAHMAGCIAEHKLNRPVIGVIYDGTGLGDDHRIWGGEILIGDLTGYIRAGHLRYCSIQGGDMAVKEPWRTAVSYLYSIGFNDLSFINDVEDYKKLSVTAALKAGLNCHESSSMGRLFDCVSALLGLCSTITYDAQAAIRLEGIADKSVESCYEFYINEENGCLSIDYSELLRHIIIDIRKGQKASVISGKFHNTIAAATAAVVREVSRIHGTTDVVLSGGCFENLLLLELMLRKLEHQGCKVYFNERLPCNDGGISFGQLAAADRMLKG